MDVDNLSDGQKEALAAYEEVHGKDNPDVTSEGLTPEALPSEGDELEVAIPSEEGDDEPEEGLILNKFKSQEALIEAYKALEAKQGKGGDVPSIDDPLATPTEVAEVIAHNASSNLDMDVYKSEVFKTGELSPESRTALEKAKIPASFIDSFVSSEVNNKARTAEEVYNIVGSKEDYQGLLGWAKNLPNEDQMYYNSQLQSGNSIMVKNAVKALKAIRATTDDGTPQEGQPPEVRLGGATPAVKGNMYKSQGDMIKDMSDPRWQTDMDYTNKVIKKVERSNF